jgi:formate hydrogenlyase subunit 6/NADH:ubiquinone oxidoreductase subunit I
MTVHISIRETACRGCSLCADICPTLVFELDEKTRIMKAPHEVDCIACLSCAYACPSAALTHTEYSRVKDFCRDTNTSRNLDRYL